MAPSPDRRLVKEAVMPNQLREQRLPRCWLIGVRFLPARPPLLSFFGHRQRGVLRMGKRRGKPQPPENRFVLHRFNGDEVYRFKSAVMWAYRTETGVTLWFEVAADHDAIRRCEDTAE